MVGALSGVAGWIAAEAWPWPTYLAPALAALQIASLVLAVWLDLRVRMRVHAGLLSADTGDFGPGWSGVSLAVWRRAATQIDDAFSVRLVRLTRFVMALAVLVWVVGAAALVGAFEPAP